MKTLCHLLILVAAMLAPQVAFAQEEADVIFDADSCIAAVADSCPIDYKDEWVITSVTTDADTVHVELQVPSSLAGFLPMLAGEGDNVRLVWLRQMVYFGVPWRQLCRGIIAARRVLIIDLKPKDSRVSAEIIINPDKLEKLNATIKD